MTRKGRQDALNPSHQPRWLVVRNRQSVAVQWQPLGPDANLRAAMGAERARREADGWMADAIPYFCAFFFCARGEERMCVSIECFEPGTGPMGR